MRSAKETCWPMGVPYILELNLRAQIVDDDKQIIFLYEELMDHRLIYLDVLHSEHLSPSWYGELGGRDEGDELVVDTVGFNDRTFLDDHYDLPHTTQLHVIERFKLVDYGNTFHRRRPGRLQ